MRDGALKDSLSFPRTSYPQTYKHFQGIQRNFIPRWDLQILSAAGSFNRTVDNKHLNVTYGQIKGSAKAHTLKNNA